MEGLELISEIFINESFTPNHKAIIDMIRNRRVVSLYYRGDSENSPGWRKLEMVAYGEDNGVKYIRAWQISGKTLTGNNRWKFFRVDRIRNVNFSSNQTYDKPRPNFNTMGDKHLSKIYAIADFSKKDDTQNTEKINQNQSDKNTGLEKSTSLVRRLRTLKEMLLEWDI